VVIVHGLGEHSGRYGEVARHLTAAGYLVLAFDLRGHGRTEGPRGHARGFGILLDDVDEVVGEAAGRGRALPAFLYGHSLGGSIVLNYALRRQPQLAGLVVSSPLLQPTIAPGAWRVTLARTLQRIWPALTFANTVDPADLSRDPEVVRAYREDPLVHRRVSVRLGTQMLRAGRWALAHADGLRVPTLLMHGTADSLTSPAASRLFARRAENLCQLRLWDGCFHELHWERERAAVLEFVVDWLRRGRDSAGGGDATPRGNPQ
jgi:alpha-beta hydrolase superfamily lysophospholipase